MASNITPISRRAVAEALPAYPGLDAVGTQEHLTLARLWRSVRRHKWLIMLLAILGAVVGTYKALSATPMYQATVTLAVEPERANLASITGPVVMVPSFRFYETQTALIRSRAIAARVVERLRLVDRDPLTRPPAARREYQPLRLLEQRLDEWKRLARERIWPGGTEAAADPATPAMSPQQRGARALALTGTIQGGLDVRGSQNTQIMSITYRADDPEFAAEVANAVARAYIDFRLESRLDRVQHASSWLTEQLDELRQKVASSEAELTAFQSQERLMMDSDNLEAFDDSRLQSLNAAVIAAQQRYNELSKRYGPKHPKMIAATAALRDVRGRLQQESDILLASKEKKSRLTQLEREAATNRTLYETFLTRFKEAGVSQDPKFNSARIVDAALVPGAPYAPDEIRIIGQWLLIGLLGGIATALAREYLDRTFKAPAQVEEKLGMPVLAAVPLLQRRELTRARKGRSTSSDAERFYFHANRSSFAESINHVRTSVLYSNVDKPPGVVLVTSATQGEGKTTLATNLSAAFAQLDDTLLIDADLRKPRLAHLSGRHGNPGLVEFVAGSNALDECLYKDRDCDRLSILHAGAVPPNPLELVSSKRLADALAEMRGRFAHIVIDTAPVLPVSDAVVLAHLADTVLLVLKADSTTQATAQEMLTRLEQARIETLGIVLSQVDRRKAYYYDASDYYSRYYAYAERKQARAS